MTRIMENLVTMQELLLRADPLKPSVESQVRTLRQEVPPAILLHFDRLIARGKKGVAMVRNGVCSECHLRISSGHLANLAYTSELHRCDNCGRYLYLPENEPLGLNDPHPHSKGGTRKSARKAPAQVE